jgi:hypothetical protein
MKILTLKDKYRYFETKLDYVFQDTGATAIRDIVVQAKQGSTVKHEETVSLPSSGDYSGSIDIERSAFGTGKHTLLVDGEEQAFVIDYRAVLIEKGLQELLAGFEKINVYDELAVYQADGSSRVTFTNLRPDSNITVLKNGADLTLHSDYYLDYSEGKVVFKQTILNTDDINVSYQFSLFGEDTYASFLDLALDEMNAQPPATGYNFENAPRVFDPPMVIRAYSKCLARLLLDMSFWNNSLIFPEPTSLKSSLQSFYQSAIQEYNELKKSTKGLRMVSPRGISSMKIGMPRVIDGINYKAYTVGAMAGGIVQT